MLKTELWSNLLVHDGVAENVAEDAEHEEVVEDAQPLVVDRHDL
jgi:hypothetical protein